MIKPGRGHPLRLHYPGRHALPQDPNHREGDQGGARRIFIGLENINPEISHRQEAAEDHRISRHARSARPWRADLRWLHPRLPGGYSESILRDIEIIKRELPLDTLEFFFLTPLPGSRTTRPVEEGSDDPTSTIRPDHVAHHAKMTDQK